MNTRGRDTTPDAERVQMTLLRQAPSWRKLEMVGQLNQTVRVLMLEGLRQRYPNAAQGEIRRRLAILLLGDEVAARVYGPFSDP